VLRPTTRFDDLTFFRDRSTVEQALRDICAINVEGEGFRLSYRLAADNLRLGSNVVAHSCNPIELTRNEWENVALESGASYKEDSDRNSVLNCRPKTTGLIRQYRGCVF
jgi:hypothetical protein